MAEVNEKNLVKDPQAPLQDMEQADEPPKSTPKETYRGRYKEKHPDLDLDNEDAFYDQANKNLDELENYRESNDALGKAFDETPLLGGLVMAAKNGENPFVYLAENIGPDMDVRELANNPDFSKKMGEALQKFMDKQKQGLQARKEQGENVAKSFETLKEIQKERGLSDEQCVKMAKDFFGEVDEDGNPVGKESWMQLASKGVVTKDMWDALFNARNYASDIAAAEERARASALNEKIQNPLRDFGNTGLPKSMPSGGAGRGERKLKKDNGSLESFKASLGIEED